MRDYLSELLSIQCEHAYGTAQRLKSTGTLSDEDMLFLVRAQEILLQTCDRFRVVKTEKTEVNNDGNR